MAAREVQGIVWLRADFARRALQAGGAPIGVDRQRRRCQRRAHHRGLCAADLGGVARGAGRGSAGVPTPMPVAVEPRVWFNPAVSSRDYLVPGLIAIIMTLTGALLTAMVIAREWERGTMEALMVTRVSDPRDPARQARALFRARHGRHGRLGGDGRVAVRRCRCSGSLWLLPPPRRCSCWPRSAWAC